LPRSVALLVGLSMKTDSQETQCHWTRTSPSSPSHILHTAPHALVAFVGGCGFVCFSLALVQKAPLDASLAAVLFLLCLYIYTLQSERCRQKSMLQEAFTGVSIHLPGDSKFSASTSAKAKAADGMSELDLTGYAKTLGVSMRNGVAHKEGSTLNKILMDALAKEYLRCISALKSYQAIFGPLLGEDAVESQPSDTNHEISNPMGTYETDSFNLAMDLAAVAETLGEIAQTPRSPPGPPSPDRRRPGQTANVGPALSALERGSVETSPAPKAPANTPQTAGHPHSSYDAGMNISVTLTDSSCSQAHTQQSDEAPSSPLRGWSGNQPASPPKRSFGLFGGRRGEKDSL